MKLPFLLPGSSINTAMLEVVLTPPLIQPGSVGADDLQKFASLDLVVVKVQSAHELITLAYDVSSKSLKYRSSKLKLGV